MNVNEKGITLMELILALSLVSIILTLIASFYHFGALSFSNESVRSSNQQNMRLVMNDITKEIRNADASSTITVDQESSTITIGEIVFKLQDNTIMKDSKVLMDNVSQFAVSMNGNSIIIEIKSTPTRLSTVDTLKTTITVRK